MGVVVMEFKGEPIKNFLRLSLTGTQTINGRLWLLLLCVFVDLLHKNSDNFVGVLGDAKQTHVHC
jgi:hypothetical protein